MLPVCQLVIMHVSKFIHVHAISLSVDFVLLSACQWVCPYWPACMSVFHMTFCLPVSESMRIGLPICLSILSFYLPVSESVRICLPICLSFMCPSFCLSVSLSVFVFLYVCIPGYIIAFNWLFFSLVILYISGLSFCFVFLADWSMSMYTVFLHD